MLVITLPGRCHVVVNGEDVWFHGLACFLGRRLTREEKKHFHSVKAGNVPRDQWLRLLSEEDAIFSDPVRRVRVKQQYVDIRKVRAVPVNWDVKAVRAVIFDPETNTEHTGVLMRTEYSVTLRLDRPFIPTIKFGLPVMTACDGGWTMMGFALFENGVVTVVPAQKVQPTLAMSGRRVTVSGNTFRVRTLATVLEE